MGINVNFNVLNQKGAPALYEDLFANRPTASYAGRIFLATDTGNLYRDTGTTWTQIATAGNNPGIDDVLAVGQLFTANRDIDCNVKNFDILNFDILTLASDQMSLGFFTQNNVQLGDYLQQKDGTRLNIDAINNIINTAYQATSNGLIIDYGTQLYQLGDPNNTTNYIEVNASTAQVNTYANNNTVGLKQGVNVFGTAGTTIGFWGVANSYEFVVSPTRSTFSYNGTTTVNGLDINFSTDEYYFGNLSTLGTRFYIDNGSGYIFAYNNASQTGLRLAFNGYYSLGSTNNNMLFIDDILNEVKYNLNGINYAFYSNTAQTIIGDWDGQQQATRIVVDDQNTEITLYTSGGFTLNDNGSGTLISGSASGNSGDHLVITINGTPYKINLLNP